MGNRNTSSEPARAIGFGYTTLMSSCESFPVNHCIPRKFLSQTICNVQYINQWLPTSKLCLVPEFNYSSLPARLILHAINSRNKNRVLNKSCRFYMSNIHKQGKSTVGISYIEAMCCILMIPYKVY